MKKTIVDSVDSVDNEIDEIYEQYKDIDFSKAKPADAFPHLAKLREQLGGKTMISIRIDNDVLVGVKAKAKAAGKGYQSLINEAIRKGLQADQIKEALREVLREEKSG